MVRGRERMKESLDSLKNVIKERMFDLETVFNNNSLLKMLYNLALKYEGLGVIQPGQRASDDDRIVCGAFFDEDSYLDKIESSRWPDTLDMVIGDLEKYIKKVDDEGEKIRISKKLKAIKSGDLRGQGQLLRVLLDVPFCPTEQLFSE